MYKILIINKSKEEITPLEKATNSLHFITKFVTNCSDGKYLFDSFLPDIVLCSLQQIEKDDGNLFKYIRQKKSTTTIHILIDKLDKELIFKAMTFGINNYLILPLTTTECSYYLKQCKQILKLKPQIFGSNTIKKTTQFEITTDNSLEKIPEITNSIIQQINPLFTPIKDDIKLGIEELIINAIEHGNLSITYNEKSSALQNNSFEKLIQSRINKRENKNKKVHIIFHQEQTFDEWYIEDEGNGFDPCEIPSLSKAFEINRLHGRGILINRFHFDEIEYCNNGRSVRVRKYV